jgi:hypothetical protein
VHADFALEEYIATHCPRARDVAHTFQKLTVPPLPNF